MKRLLIAIRVFCSFAILLGLLYPFFILAIGKIFFPYQADGSLLEYREKKIGSALIAQEFTQQKYFHSRFSAINYDAKNSGSSELSPTNKNLYQQVAKRIKQVTAENNLSLASKLPADMVLASASGLDPHISLANALLQLPRVTKNRSLPQKIIKRLIYNHLDSDFVGIWGQAGVNVLQLNLALDKLEEAQL